MAKKQHKKPRKKKRSSSSLNKLLPSLNDVLNQTVMLYQQGEAKEALLLTEQALVQFPDQALLLGNAGTFSMAVGAQQAALDYYQKSLELNPENPDIYNNLGNILKEQSQFDEAETAYKNALRFRPDYVNAFYNLGSLLLLKKCYKQSEECLLQALELKPDYAEVYYSLGNLFFEQKRYIDAEQAYHNTLKFRSDYVEVYNNLAALYLVQKRYQEAEVCYQNALILRPDYAEVFNNLGSLYVKQKRYKEAEVCYQNALILRPDYAESYNNLANLFLQQNCYKEAEEFCQKALQLRPDYADPYENLGTIYLAQKCYAEAEEAYHNALIHGPDNAELNYNLGNLYQKQKRYKEAEVCYLNALKFQPDLINARANLSLLLLTLGRYQEGWESYETRYHPDKEDRKTFLPEINVPQWCGESLNGKSLFIWPEQGIGDEIMFASCLNDLKKFQCKITVACDGRLQDLFARSFPFVDVIEKDLTNCYQMLENTLDYHCAIGSLPKFFRNNSREFGCSSKYLKAEQKLLAKWKDRYKQLEHPINIGISWWGGKDENHQQQRSIALTQWLSIVKNKANFINLQYGGHQKEIAAFERETDLHLYDWDDADALTDLDNFASQIKALDLVISIDNSTVHFSGALGVNTFVLLPYAQEWRWMDERDDSPWYPQVMKLFRQQKEGNWENVIQEVVNALNERLD